MDAGVLAVSKSIFQYFPSGLFSLEKQIFPILIEHQQLAGYPVNQRFYDIGTFERLITFQKTMP
jgi:NDP-sugar pyrophosphorylase family protein